MKKIIIAALVIAGLSVQVRAENDYNRKILGRWKATGSKCDNAGNCSESIQKKHYIEFCPDGKVILTDDRNEKRTYSYEIENDMLTLIQSPEEKIDLKIIKLTDTTMLCLSLEDNVIIKMTREEDNSRDPESDNFNRLIIGKWKAVGSRCNSTGECVISENDEFYIDFSADGTVTLSNTGNPTTKVEYSIEGNQLILAKSPTDKFRITLVKLTSEMMLWQLQEDGDIAKLVKVGDTGRQETNDVQADDNYSKLITGRWQLVGDRCSESGDCTGEIENNAWIEFYEDGSVRMGGKDGEYDNITYSIDGDLITLTFKNSSLVLKIITLTDTSLFWQNQTKNCFQKLARVEKPVSSR